ncbi:MAG: hypothetical protein AAB439_02575 [Patescibacteria group bacterium]
MSLTLPITHFWNGTPCKELSLHGSVTLNTTDGGILISATLPHQKTPNVPASPAGSRVHNLWEHDVVECFLVGEDTYLEVELGAGGHFLVLDFSAPRVRKNEYENFQPTLTYNPRHTEHSWSSSILIPPSMIPKKLSRANAFVIVGENFLAYAQTPGDHPNFHQPDTFPQLSLTF